MRPLKSLTFEGIKRRLWWVFGGLEDGREGGKVKWELGAVVMSAFAMMFFQHRSLLEFQRRMKEKQGKSNLERVFGVAGIPSDTQMREILDGVEVEPLRQVLGEIFEEMRRTGWAINYVTEVGGKKYYTVVLDGSEYFHSTKIECPGCLRKERGKTTHYSHVMVGATLVKAGSRRILPLEVEEVRNEDGSEKQDCEIKAGKRLVERLRKEHPQLEICIGGDDLYAHGPFIKELREKRMGLVLTAKPGSHKELFEWVTDLEELEATEHGRWEAGPACKRKFYEYRAVSQIPLTKSGEVLVNFIEVWERDRTGKLLYHNSWVTDFEITPESAPVIIGIGRSRWKIENEHFNIQKNQGYELEHNYGHGQRTLSMVMCVLNLLAFTTHKVIELGDQLYQRCCLKLAKYQVWDDLRCLFNRFAYASWSALLTTFLGEPLLDSS